MIVITHRCIAIRSRLLNTELDLHSFWQLHRVSYLPFIQCKQENHAIAKMTARCAQYMSAHM